MLMEKWKAKLQNRKGFTLVEMLIVVAIIAILIAVSIPMISGALDKAKEATDKANVRAAIAEASIEYLTNTVDGNDNDITAKMYNAATGALESGSTVTAYGQASGNTPNVVWVKVTGGQVHWIWAAPGSTAPEDSADWKQGKP